MIILTRLQALYALEQQDYCYVISFKFKRKFEQYQTLYTIGVSNKRPEKAMIDIAQSFYIQQRYIPECKVLRARKVPKAQDSILALKELLKLFKYDTKRLVFLNSRSLYTEAVKQFDEVIPSIKTMEYEYYPLLPNWCYTKDELQELKKQAFQYNDIGYILKL